MVILGFILYQIINFKKIRRSALEKKQAYTDQLTGRGNRYLFLAILDKLIKNNEKFAVCCMDLDGFKQINDTMGHDAGDELLIYLARVFDEKLPSNAVAYRLGGDEFAIIIREIKTTHDITKVLDYMKKQFEVPIVISGTSISLQYSLGIATFPEDATNRQDLIMYADDAMYYIKENGKNGYYFHNKTLRAKIENKNKMEKDLKDAYEKEEFGISFQPRIDITNKDKVCLEALLHWNHPVLGILDSEYFISQADEMGIIIKLDRYVLTTVCKKINELKLLGYKNIEMYLNISNRHALKDDFINELCNILRENNIQKNEICFEINNDINISKIKLYKNMIEKLRLNGARIAINNFSIKYEDLVLYKDLNADGIKLYANYISEQSNLDRECLNNVINLSKQINCGVAIVGIVSDIQLQAVIEFGASKLQGDLLFKRIYSSNMKEVMNIYLSQKTEIIDNITKYKKI